MKEAQLGDAACVLWSCKLVYGSHCLVRRGGGNVEGQQMLIQ